MEQGTRYCLDDCPFKRYRYDEITNVVVCMHECAGKYPYRVFNASNNFTRCVSECPENLRYHLSNNHTCIEKCPDGMGFVMKNTCLESCGEYYYYPTMVGALTKYTKSRCRFNNETDYGHLCFIHPTVTMVIFWYFTLLTVALVIFNIKCCFQTVVFVTKGYWRAGQGMISFTQRKMQHCSSTEIKAKLSAKASGASGAGADQDPKSE